MRKDEDLAQIMTKIELYEYRQLENAERYAEGLLYDSRQKMRKMRAAARKRQARK